MARRSGQVGQLVRKGNTYRVRFMLDVPGVAKRVYKSVFVAPVSGPGSLTKPELQRRAMELINEAGANAEVTLKKCEAVNLSPTFRQQASLWLHEAQHRKRKPIKPHTLSNWTSELKWINEQIGDVPLSAVDNKLVKDEIVAVMADNGYAPKTISNVVGTIQMVVASVVDDRGEEVYLVKWNHRFMDMPEITDQHTPTFTDSEVQQIVSNAVGQYAILFALLAGSGLRIGEALALQVDDVHNGTLSITKSLWNGRLQSPKTKNAVREVDLHPALAEVLCSHLECNRSQSEYIFHHAGKPLHQSNILHSSLHPILKALGRPTAGFHAFRRYRNTFLRKARVPDGLIQFWMGHARASMTDTYDKVRDDLEFRRFTAEQVGLGFDPPEVRKPVTAVQQEEPCAKTVSV